MNKLSRALRNLESSENQFLMECDWIPADPDDPLNSGDDWLPPEDRKNYWDRDRALVECRRRAQEACNK